MTMNTNQKMLLTEIYNNASQYNAMTRANLLQFAQRAGVPKGVVQTTLKNARKVSRGVYDLTNLISDIDPVKQPASPENQVENVVEMQPKVVSSDNVYVPATDPKFQKWGNYHSIEKVIRSKKFFPVFISGPSGNGKTMSVEQACANLGREYVRVQINPETDEDDLLGGFRLLDGQTVFDKGPVIRAMEAGAILLIDEIDRGSNKLMALQGVLEGKPVMIKKTGEVIHPKKGFNVFATANTLGRGSETGHYVSAVVIDDAFLERFIITLPQGFPSEAMELKIVKANLPEGHKEIAQKMVKWANLIRKSFDNGSIDDTMSTRRLVHIANAIEIFDNVEKSVELGISRYDDETKGAFIDLWNSMSEDTKSETVKDSRYVDFTA